jgi:hypothetical protein
MSNGDRDHGAWVEALTVTWGSQMLPTCTAGMLAGLRIIMDAMPQMGLKTCGIASLMGGEVHELATIW